MLIASTVLLLMFIVAAPIEEGTRLGASGLFLTIERPAFLYIVSICIGAFLWFRIYQHARGQLTNASHRLRSERVPTNRFRDCWYGLSGFPGFLKHKYGATNSFRENGELIAIAYGKLTEMLKEANFEEFPDAELHVESAEASESKPGHIWLQIWRTQQFPYVGLCRINSLPSPTDMHRLALDSKGSSQIRFELDWDGGLRFEIRSVSESGRLSTYSGKHYRELPNGRISTVRDIADKIRDPEWFEIVSVHLFAGAVIASSIVTFWATLSGYV